MTQLYKATSMLCLIALFCFNPGQASAQGTYDQIYTILQTNCQGATCHTNAANAAGLSFEGSKSDVYTALVGATPSTANAAARNDLLIEAGHPERSFLLKKVSHGLGAYQSEDIQLANNDGDVMPLGLKELNPEDVELIRQWVFHGAPQSGTVTNYANLKDYYDNYAGDFMIAKPDAPDPSEGFQIHHGPIFFEPFDEKEFRLKYDMQLPNDLEVNRVDVKMNDESHHFILYAFDSKNAANGADAGLREVGIANPFEPNTDYILAWQNDQDIELPEGTAYKWDVDKVLDLNYHIFNPRNAPLPGEVYINIYTQPKGTAQAEMSTALVNNFAFFIPSDNQPHSFSANYTTSTADPQDDSISVWMLSTHTHSRGTDYDVYLRDDQGAKADQIYEGFYSFDYSFNQGFFDYEHPPVRFYEPLLELDGSQGMVHEATYVNNTGGPLTFGLTTEDEMMIIYLNYVEGNFKLEPDTAVGIEDVVVENTFNIAPNPYSGSTAINYTLKEASNVQLEVFDVMGRRVNTLADDFQRAGTHNYRLNSEGNTSGVYFVHLTVDGNTITKKIVDTSK